MNTFTHTMGDLNEFKLLISGLEKGNSPISIQGLTDSQIAHMVFACSQYQNRQMLVLTYNETQAKRLQEDLLYYINDREIYFYPAKEIVFYNIDAHSHQILEERLRTMAGALSNRPCIIIASIESFLSRLMSMDVFRESFLTITMGQQLDLDEMIHMLIRLGYERVERVEAKGHFSIRGGIMDIFPVICDNPYRIELFDDEVDSIRIFDYETQVSMEKVEEALITPAQELILNDVLIQKAVGKLREDTKSFRQKLRGESAEKLQQKIEALIERLENHGIVQEVDNYLHYFYQEPSSLLDYCSEDAIIFVHEPTRVKEQAHTALKEFEENFKGVLDKGEVLPVQGKLLASYEKVLHELGDRQICVFSSLPKRISDFPPKQILNFTTRMAQSINGKINILIEELKNYRSKGYKILLLCQTKERLAQLSSILGDYEIPFVHLEAPNRPILSGQVVLMAGSLYKGFEYYGNKFLVMTEEEIFGTSKKQRSISKRKDGRALKSFTDLNIGDYVVHENHGIGKYIGIEQLKVEGAKKDYFKIKYSDSDLLYVPIEQMDMVQKYIGADGMMPKLNKLGGAEWKKTKTKVSSAIKEMAIDLLNLYAVRQTSKGHAFPKDTPWQKQFEDMFPYQETPDQLRCIEEVKSDMERMIPMDRLLCGDVGYGKTEVAIRAVFKCVMEGKQVAFLVPTTILAQQHYSNFVQRFSQFPVGIEMLSRFRTDKQQDEIIERIRVGSVDIVIGTHRMLSKDVQFKDLGLLIIDEEQRFGVQHKEMIKLLKKNVDVLTLTATPIPRTLHMSLIGLRDMSIIEDPPEERYPVQTYVVEYHDGMIAEAIRREITRGGQVYFVYNRVQGIEKMASRIRKLVPEAKVIVGHGQMGERELENVMLDFLNGEYNVLVCTTIIETGLDISNVNTMIIYDADKMGLSQLYQLRGRVGRSNRLAYAYLTYEKDKVLTEVAEKRLKAIKEFTEFGSGFKIAMRDLEIRGAGNLIGGEQHGHMAAIGYDLYCKLLEDTIRELKGEELTKDVEASIEINVNAYIPENYISNENQKFEIYKKIAATRDKQDAYGIEEEIEDRFGTIPEPVMNLIAIAYIKAMAQKAGITTVSETSSYAKFQFHGEYKINLPLIGEIIHSYGNRIHFHGGIQPYLMLKYRNQANKLKEIRELLEKISGMQ
ncbi:MAG: transcription-repair coupling factor [Bacillota bacterium]